MHNLDVHEKSFITLGPGYCIIVNACKKHGLKFPIYVHEDQFFQNIYCWKTHLIKGIKYTKGLLYIINILTTSSHDTHSKNVTSL